LQSLRVDAKIYIFLVTLKSKLKMKKLIYILPFIFFSQLNAQHSSPKQKISGYWNNRMALTQAVPEHIQKHFDIAINEIEQMLKGEKPLSFKRAVYLVENAYYEGKVSWEEYNKEILRIKSIINKMIDERGLRQYKTAGNWAIFTYMMDSIPENNFKPYHYDYENFIIDTNLRSSMVWYLLKTKKGNCMSLPYLYKILADETKVEAFLAFVPMHCYIKHRDETDKEKWWNMELTTASFSRTIWIIETFNVSETAIKSGLFMKSLTDVESVASCIYDLLSFYEAKTDRYSDDFVKKCYEIGLPYYYNSRLQIRKLDDLRFRLDNKMTYMGISSYSQILNYPDLVKEYIIMDSLHNYVYNKLGYTSLTDENYDMLYKEFKETQAKLKIKQE
jgi:hypothetical protein